MFAQQVNDSLQHFEVEFFQLSFNIVENCSSIKLHLTDFYLAQALSCLFKLCNFTDEYLFEYGKNDKIVDNKGYIKLATLKGRAGQQVDSQFFNQLKKNVADYVLSFNQCWVPYKVDDEEFLSFDTSDNEIILCKPYEEGIYAILYYLRKDSECNIKIDHSEKSDVIMGSKYEIDNFLEYLNVIGKEMQSLK